MLAQALILILKKPKVINLLNLKIGIQILKINKLQ